MIILDEPTYAFNYGLLDEDEMLSFLKEKPTSVHLVTGRHASQKLIGLA